MTPETNDLGTKPQYKGLKVLVLSFLAGTILKGILKTVRWQSSGVAIQPDFWKQGPMILAFWHGHSVVAPSFRMSYSRLPWNDLYSLISQHRDGQIIGKFLEGIGFKTIAGSSSRGGARAFRSLLSILKKGKNIAIAPDGPRGPARKVKMGIVKLAQATGAPIHIISFAVDRAWVFGSWDSMILPKPRAKGVRFVSEAIYIDKNLSEEDLEKECERIEKHFLKCEELVKTQLKEISSHV